jgi:hydrogenase nickel incorporation protein HypB
MFAAARLMVLAKTDLLPHVDFDVARCIEYAHRVNPSIEVMQVSATKGDGMDLWINWIRLHVVTTRHARGQHVGALKRRVAELEAKLAEPR